MVFKSAKILDEINLELSISIVGSRSLLITDSVCVCVCVCGCDEAVLTKSFLLHNFRFKKTTEKKNPKILKVV